MEWEMTQKLSLFFIEFRRNRLSLRQTAETCRSSTPQLPKSIKEFFSFLFSFSSTLFCPISLRFEFALCCSRRRRTEKSWSHASQINFSDWGLSIWRAKPVAHSERETLSKNTGNWANHCNFYCDFLTVFLCLVNKSNWVSSYWVEKQRKRFW